MCIGVECGGTFTDVVVLDDDGRLVATDKVFSTPHSPAMAVAEGLSRLAPELTAGARLLHGSTVATNALIERKGARVGLIVTSPRPVVEREHVVEVGERIGADGRPLVALDDDSVRRALALLTAAGVDVVAVSLLHSYANPAHELRVKAIAAAEFGGLEVTLSAECAREYERTTTTTVDAFLRPTRRCSWPPGPPAPPEPSRSAYSSMRKCA